MSRQSDQEVRNARRIEEFENSKPVSKDELMPDQEQLDEKLFAELQEQANAVDRVMTRNGPPEYDWTSG